VSEPAGVSVQKAAGGSTSVASARSSREGKPSTAGPLAAMAPTPLSSDPSSSLWPRAWRSYVALGDSFTEGLEDERRADGRHLGWADRVAGALAAGRGEGDFTYANLAIRGRLLPEVMGEQVAQAVALGPDLVTVGAGVNDALRRRFDLDMMATRLERGVRELRATGADVVLFSFGDPARRSRAMAPIRGRLRGLNSAVRSIAAHYGCRVVDFWGAAVFDDDRLWDEDRLHLSPQGHALVAESVLETLGHGSEDWRTPMVSGVPSRSTLQPVRHARWVARHASPWLSRRVRGQSSGDRVTAKNPAWVVVNRDGQPSTVD
jgi:lysophospholipase L1-like esterase